MKVDIYTTPTCGYCHQAKSFLTDRGIAFTEHDVSRDRTAGEEMVRLTGQMGVPVIVVGGETVVGFNRARLEQLLAGAGHDNSVSLGLKVANTSRFSEHRGAYVGSVTPSSPGEKAGLRPRDIIVSINRTQIDGADDLERMISSLRRGSAVVIAFVREGQTLQSEISI
jgi:glutaredoxin 3